MQLSDEENSRYTTYMNKYSKACCGNTGSLVLSMGLAIAAICYLISERHFALTGLHESILVLGIIICVALADKIFSSLWTRWKMLLLISSLIAKISNTITIHNS